MGCFGGARSQHDAKNPVLGGFGRNSYARDRNCCGDRNRWFSRLCAARCGPGQGLRSWRSILGTKKTSTERKRGVAGWPRRRGKEGLFWARRPVLVAKPTCFGRPEEGKRPRWRMGQEQNPAQMFITNFFSPEELISRGPGRRWGVQEGHLRPPRGGGTGIFLKVAIFLSPSGPGMVEVPVPGGRAGSGGGAGGAARSLPDRGKALVCRRKDPRRAQLGTGSRKKPRTNVYH